MNSSLLITTTTVSSYSWSHILNLSTCGSSVNDPVLVWAFYFEQHPTSIRLSPSYIKVKHIVYCSVFQGKGIMLSLNYVELTALELKCIKLPFKRNKLFASIMRAKILSSPDYVPIYSHHIQRITHSLSLERPEIPVVDMFPCQKMILQKLLET